MPMRKNDPTELLLRGLEATVPNLTLGNRTMRLEAAQEASDAISAISA